jgi:hypothetical protein
MTRLILIAIHSWNAWRAKRRLARALPDIVERRDNVLPALRRKHKNTKPVIAQNRRVIHAALGLEVK